MLNTSWRQHEHRTRFSSFIIHNSQLLQRLLNLIQRSLGDFTRQNVGGAASVTVLARLGRFDLFRFVLVAKLRLKAVRGFVQAEGVELLARREGLGAQVA